MRANGCGKTRRARCRRSDQSHGPERAVPVPAAGGDALSNPGPPSKAEHPGSGLHPPLFIPFHSAKALGKVFLKVTFKSKTHAWQNGIKAPSTWRWPGARAALPNLFLQSSSSLMSSQIWKAEALLPLYLSGWGSCSPPPSWLPSGQQSVF